MSTALASLPAPFWLLGLVPILLAVLLWKVLVSTALVAVAGWSLVFHGTEDVMVLAVVLTLTSAAAVLLSFHYRPFARWHVLPEVLSPDTTGGGQPLEAHRLETHA